MDTGYAVVGEAPKQGRMPPQFAARDQPGESTIEEVHSQAPPQPLATAQEGREETSGGATSTIPLYSEVDLSKKKNRTLPSNVGSTHFPNSIQSQDAEVGSLNSTKTASEEVCLYVTSNVLCMSLSYMLLFILEWNRE